MTKEEARLTLQDNFGYLSQEHPRILEALRVALDALSQPSLPSNLDEAAKNYRDFREECGIKDPVMLNEIEEAHYSGAEWMAGQGQSKEGIVVDGDFINFDDGATFIDVCPTQETPAFNIKNNDEVIVQIRKK